MRNSDDFLKKHKIQEIKMRHYNCIKFMDFKSVPMILCQFPSQISCLGDT